MNLSNLYNSDQNISSDFTNFLQDIKPNVDAYTSLRSEALKHRMFIIGKVAEYKMEFPQRSREHQLLSQVMSNESWSPNVISNNTIAYRVYRELKGNVNPEFQELADKCNVTQLCAMGRNEDKTIRFDAAKVLKQTGKVPTQNQLDAYNAGRTDKKFEFYHQKNNTRIESENLRTEKLEPIPTPKPEPIVVSPETREFRRMNIMDEARQDFLQNQVINNDRLPLIKDMRSAHIYSGSVEEAFIVVEQQCMVSERYIVRLEEMLQRLKNTVQVKAEVVQTSDYKTFLFDTPHEQLTPEQKRDKSQALLGRL